MQARPSTGVLVIDCTAFGDVSRLLLGGRQPHVKEAVATQASAGRSSAHLMSALLPPAAAAVATSLPLAAPQPAASRAAPPPLGARAAAGWAAVAEPADIAQRFGLPVAELNPQIPLPNLHLIPSGVTKQQPCTGLGAGDIL